MFNHILYLKCEPKNKNGDMGAGHYSPLQSFFTNAEGKNKWQQNKFMHDVFFSSCILSWKTDDC